VKLKPDGLCAVAERNAANKRLAKTIALTIALYIKLSWRLIDESA
jgi:hypothetical protein